MWPNLPNDRLQDTKERQARIRAEAASNRLAGARAASYRTYRVSGVQLQVGDLTIVVGRRLGEDDARALRPAH
jgi:hypothetical protein